MPVEYDFIVVDVNVVKVDAQSKRGYLVATCYSQWEAEQVAIALKITPPKPQPF